MDEIDKNRSTFRPSGIGDDLAQLTKWNGIFLLLWLDWNLIDKPNPSVISQGREDHVSSLLDGPNNFSKLRERDSTYGLIGSWMA